MSRYELPPLNPDHSVAVGWDAPLENYFVSVFNETQDDETDAYTVVDLGSGRPGTETDVDRILDTARRYAIVPDDMREQLESDRAAKPKISRSPGIQSFLNELQAQLPPESDN